MALLVLALLQDPIDALLADLGSADEAVRAKAAETFGGLGDSQRKKAAAEASRRYLKAQEQAIQDLLAKRPDAASLKKRVKEIKDLIQRIPFPITDSAHVILQGELREKLEALWKEQYPDLTTAAQSEAVKAEADRLAGVEQAAEKCGAKDVVNQIKKVWTAAVIDRHRQWQLVLPPSAAKMLIRNEETYKKVEGTDLAMKPGEYECTVVMNHYRVLLESSAIPIDPALSKACRKWSEFIEGGGKGGAYGVHSDAPNEDMGRGGEDGVQAAWTIMCSDRDHIGAIFRWGSIGAGQHGSWWTWRG